MKGFKIFFLTSLAFLIACSSIFSILYCTFYNNVHYSEVWTAPMSQSLTPSGPIIIDEEQDWIDLKISGKCTGLGTLISPYIICDLDINANGGPFCICIDHQNVYFKIINCNLYNASGSGFFMYGSDFGEILDCTIHSNGYGIKIGIPPIPPDYHSNVKINGNHIYNNSEYGIYGLCLYDSEISNNDIVYNNKCAIRLLGDNQRVDILNNNISYNSYEGILLTSADFCEIRGNTIDYNDIAIFLDSSHNNIISGNSINNNEVGFNGSIYLHNSDSNVIEDNELTENGYYDVALDDSSYNVISSNWIITIYKKFYDEWGSSTGNIFSDNTVFWDRDDNNDILEDAYEIEEGYYGDLVAIDDDWFQISLPKGDTCEITLEFSPDYEELDLELYDSSHILLEYSYTGTYNRYISYEATSIDDYYIRVFNGINLVYSLEIDIQTPEVPPEEPEDPPPEDPPSDPSDPSPSITDNQIPGFHLGLVTVLFFIGIVSIGYLIRHKFKIGN